MKFIFLSLLIIMCSSFSSAQEPIYSEVEPRMTSLRGKLSSQLCTASQMSNDTYKYWCSSMKELPKFHRKQWEFVFILQALDERGMLHPGKKGLGFGTGKEPLPAIMAASGVEVLATDLDSNNQKAQLWTGSQHSSKVEQLNTRGICPQETFLELVKHQPLDMNNIPEDLKNFDFTWSSCAFEHLGSIENGLKFVENSLKTLKPGGVAVHTTEYNISSNEDTIDNQDTVLFRKQDIEKLVSRLRSLGYEISVNYNPGSGKLDQHIDTPPYSNDNHLKLAIGEYTTTSIGLIIHKPTDFIDPNEVYYKKLLKKLLIKLKKMIN